MADEYVRDGGPQMPETADPRDMVNPEDKFQGDKSGRPRGRGKVFFKKKVCKFCTQKFRPDYKNPDGLRRFTTERGKLLPRRITGTCAKHQRALAVEVKRARSLAFLPYVEK